MGLGKTLQMIALMLYATQRDGRMPSLVVAPHDAYVQLRSAS